LFLNFSSLSYCRQYNAAIARQIPFEERTMTRRLALALLCCLLALSNTAAGAEKSKTRILFLATPPDHPYGSHMYQHTCGVLAKCVELTPGVEAVVSMGWPKDASMLDGAKAIVLYSSPGAELLLEGPHRNKVDELMKQGVGLVAIHWAATVKKADYERLAPVWLSYLGGTWISNVGLSSGKGPLKQLMPDHPICRGWQDQEIDDEYYLNPVIRQARPLLQVREPRGKDVIVGWVYERPGGGRAFGTTLGHPYRNFQQEWFRRMIVNGIIWCAHVDVPRQGARVDLSAEVLTLPPAR
jgi:Trehalose utilisation